MSDTAHPIEVTNLTRRFRRKVALDGVSMTVRRGGVHGLVGENGAGKTTLIKHLLGLLKAKEGSVRVFGHDPVKEPEAALGQIGYLSEDRDMPPWMRVRELIRYTRAFYPAWDPDFAQELLELFHLDPDAKLKHLSRGELAKAGLLAALAHRPALLLLDEPSSGLDAMVRRDILGAIIRTVADEGRTVLFSSHLLEEVERVADRITMIHQGRVVLDMEMDALKDAHHELSLRLHNGAKALPELPGVLSRRSHGNEWTVICKGPLDALREAAQQGGEILDIKTPSLEEIFVAHAGVPIERGEG